MSRPLESRSESAPPALGPLTSALNFIGLGFLAFGIATSGRVGTSGPGLAVSVLLASSAAGWVAWTACRTWALPPAVLPVSLLVMAGAGGALSGFVSLAMVFPSVAALGATLGLPGRRAAGVILLAALGVAVAFRFGPEGTGVELGATAGVLAGSVMGLSRRATQERHEQLANIKVAEAQAEAQRARAELLAGRNHLARELHDVLAHTLSALSLQLEALDALLPGGPPSPQVGAQLAEIRRLVRDGLDEARGAVSALREDVPPLDERLRQLAAQRGIVARVTGEATRDLPADIALALYRVTQEAITNALRHAPGEAADVELRYAGDGVTLSVTNLVRDRTADIGTGPSGRVEVGLPGERGGGYGLQGIRERILLVGGSVEAGPFADGWRVVAWVPRPERP